MRSLKLTLAYDGTAYSGWQVQPGRETVQARLEASLHEVTGQTVRTVASGRTDAGVHALGQVVSLALETSLADDDLLRALNANLPDDVAVLEVCTAGEGFHAIRDARRKRYRYTLHDGPVRDVFLRRYAWSTRTGLDAAAMHRAAQALVGTHDFAAFQSTGAPRRSTVRTVDQLTVRRVAEDRIDVEIQADGFLYNMVRAIVGSLVEIGRGAQPEAWLDEVLRAADRSAAGPTAPPQGLFLVSVDYDEV
jgi:tRNA pseudouridine38-40 synthase